jgi:hypothetical protein
VYLGRKRLECDGQLLADPTLDVDLVPRRHSSRRQWTFRRTRCDPGV